MNTLYQLINVLKRHNLILSLSVTTDMPIQDISYNSNEVSAGTLFICKGFGFKADYLRLAVDNGAVACVSEEAFPDIAIPQILVSNARKALAVLSAAFFDYPQHRLTTVGITGTKGKSTTSFFMKSILDSCAEQPTGLISTIENFVGDEAEPSHLSTPESLDLQKLFVRAAEHKLRYMTLEVSSQAYKLDRLYGMDFQVGVFLNIGEDHISEFEHSDMEDYLNCKLELLKHCELAVINQNTDQFERVYETAKQHCKKVVVFGKSPGADYLLSAVQPCEGGLSFRFGTSDAMEEYRLSMAGRFNAENAAAAITVALEFGFPASAIQAGIKSVHAKGRMEIFEKDDITVIVDYAHNYLSFSRLYETVKQDYAGRRIIALYGCPGGRSQVRRRDVSRLSGENADFVYLTAEDPQFETVEDICAELSELLTPYQTPHKTIPDRKEAIRTAIQEAKKGDVIILAAKGEENYQKIQGNYVDYESDTVLAKRFLLGK